MAFTSINASPQAHHTVISKHQYTGSAVYSIEQPSEVTRLCMQQLRFNALDMAKRQAADLRIQAMQG